MEMCTGYVGNVSTLARATRCYAMLFLFCNGVVVAAEGTWLCSTSPQKKKKEKKKQCSEDVNRLLHVVFTRT